MARPKHHTAAHDDETWMGFFRRWHEGEDSRALYAEAKVSGDTFHVHARRLKMRLKDLPEGHPARRRSLPYDQRGDEYREPNGLLVEGVWKALFALRAQGVPDTVLGPRFGVSTTVICNQARRRGLRREDLRAGVRTPPTLRCASGHLPTEWEETVGALRRARQRPLRHGPKRGRAASPSRSDGEETLWDLPFR